jgi:divalent metal cation (Fe/Co/Zn/Cd) transporter
MFASSYSGSVLATFQDTTGLSYATTREVRQTLLEVNGWSALVPVLFPVAVCAGVLATRASGWYRVARLIGAIVLLAFTVVAGFTIGLYAPSAVAMLLAVGFR